MANKTKQEQLEALKHQMQAVADAADAKGVFSADDQQALRRMMDEAKSLKDSLVEEAKAAGTMDEAKSFLASLGGSTETGTKAAGRGGEGAPVSSAHSLGDAFVKSSAYSDFLDTNTGQDGTIPSSRKGFQSRPVSFPTLKELVTGAGDNSAGALVTPERYGQVTDLVGARELTVRDLVTAGTTGSDLVEYVRVTGKTNRAAVVPEATTAAPLTTAGVTTVAAGLKPESGMTLEVVSAAVKTLAHWIPVTKRAIADAGQVRTMIDNFLLTGLAEVEEDQILNGDGTGENFEGINSVDGILTVTPTGTDLDAVIQAVRQVRTVGRRRANALVINPEDFYSDGFLLAKNSSGDYLVGDPRASIDQLNALWGLQVAVTTAQPVGRPLVGDFNQAVLWDREQAGIIAGDQVNDFMIRNLVAVLAEERLAFGVLDPEAFCRITPAGV